MQKQHYKLGKYARVADHLYRYSATKKYYAVFKCNGKTKWVALNTTDRELAPGFHSHSQYLRPLAAEIAAHPGRHRRNPVPTLLLKVAPPLW